MARHKKKHIKEGHLNIDTDFTPQQVEELRLNSHCPLFWTVLQNAGLDPTDEDATNEYHELTDNLLDDHDLFAGCEELKQSSLSSSLHGESDVALSETRMLSKAHRKKILEQNTRI